MHIVQSKEAEPQPVMALGFYGEACRSSVGWVDSLCANTSNVSAGSFPVVSLRMSTKRTCFKCSATPNCFKHSAPPPSFKEILHELESS